MGKFIDDLPIISEEILRKPYGFSFAQALYLMNCWGMNPTIVSHNIWCPLTSDIWEITKDPEQMTTNLLGMTGVTGPLAPKRKNNTDRMRLWNQFHHKLMILLYRTIQKFTPTLNRCNKDETTIGKYLSAILGATKSQSYGDKILGFAGLIWHHNGPQTLSQIMQQYLQADTQVETFCGSWRNIPSNLQTKIGHAKIGRSSIGNKALLPQTGIKVTITAKTIEQYDNLLGKMMKEIKSMISWLLGSGIRAQIEVRINPNAEASTHLGRNKLGINTWLAKSKQDRNYRHTSVI